MTLVYVENATDEPDYIVLLTSRTLHGVFVETNIDISRVVVEKVGKKLRAQETRNICLW